MSYDIPPPDGHSYYDFEGGEYDPSEWYWSEPCDRCRQPMPVNPTLMDGRELVCGECTEAEQADMICRGRGD
jgi:hypothetical protein